MKPIFALFSTLLLLANPLAQAQNRGWTIGGGLVSSDVVNPEQSDPVFPAVQLENKQVMFLPNLSFRWDQWSIGADGIGWQTETLNGLKTQITAGYPSSRFSIGGQRGWFRYGLNSGLSYSNGVTATQGITLGPVGYEATLGLGDRADDFSQKASLGFPLYINQSAGLTIIGTGYLQQDNASFTVNDLELSQPLTNEDFVHTGLNAFAVYQANPRLTLLVSGTLQWNDSNLTDDVSAVAPVQFNLFTMLSFYLGQL